MYFPFATLLALMVLELYREAQRGEPGVAASAAGLTGGLAGLLAVSFLLSLLLGRITVRQIREGRSAPRVLRMVRFSAAMQKGAVVGLYAAFLHLTGWPLMIRDHFGIFNRLLLDDIAAFAPFVAALTVSWLAAYRTDLMLGDRTWSRREYLAFQLRHALYIAIPWLLLHALIDASTHLPQTWQDWLDGHSLLTGAAFAIALIVLGPAMFTRFLSWRPMKPGPMRERLEAFCAKQGLPCRNILVWDVGGARILTAGVMGIIPRFRYVVFTDSFLATMSVPEIEAALAHELGHIKHRHLLKYVLFTLGFVTLISGALSLLPVAWTANRWVNGALLMALTLLYFRVIFGVLSRKFERQADAESARMMGTPVPIILALERIAQLMNFPRSLHDWRHGSIAERVSFLYQAGFDPDAIRDYHRHVRRVFWASVLAGMALIGQCVWLQDVLAERALLRAESHLRQGEYAQAHAWYGEAVGRNAGSPRAHRGLALLHADPAAGRFFDSTEALKHAGHAVSLDKTSWRNHHALARAWQANGETRRAQAGLREAIRLAPANDRAFLKEAMNKLDAPPAAGESATDPPTSTETGK